MLSSFIKGDRLHRYFNQLVQIQVKYVNLQDRCRKNQDYMYCKGLSKLMALSEGEQVEDWVRHKTDQLY